MSCHPHSTSSVLIPPTSFLLYLHHFPFIRTNLAAKLHPFQSFHTNLILATPLNPQNPRSSQDTPSLCTHHPPSRHPPSFHPFTPHAIHLHHTNFNLTQLTNLSQLRITDITLMLPKSIVPQPHRNFLHLHYPQTINIKLTSQLPKLNIIPTSHLSSSLNLPTLIPPKPSTFTPYQLHSTTPDPHTT